VEILGLLYKLIDSWVSVGESHLIVLTFKSPTMVKRCWQVTPGPYCKSDSWNKTCNIWNSTWCHTVRVYATCIWWHGTMWEEIRQWEWPREGMKCAENKTKEQ